MTDDVLLLLLVLDGVVARSALRKRPPVLECASRMTNGTPARASESAARAPAMPAPTMMTRSPTEEEEEEEEGEELWRPSITAMAIAARRAMPRMMTMTVLRRSMTTSKKGRCTDLAGRGVGEWVSV